jgi:hypothetical protein
LGQKDPNAQERIERKGKIPFKNNQKTLNRAKENLNVDKKNLNKFGCIDL